jgi:hypothetical protein
MQDLILPCDLQTFFHMFIADTASHPLQEFMESSGETNVIVSPWKPEGKDSFARTIGFSHPVTAPLAPPMARARREQRYRFYGTHGLSLETDTYVEDVPMADCFYVRERILVEPMDEGQVVVLAEFDIRFIKSTMFRSIIANTTRSECLKDIQRLGVYWAEAIATPNTSEDSVVRRRSSIAEWCRASMSDAYTQQKSTQFETFSVEAPEKAPVSRVFTFSPAMMLILGLVFLMQSWMLHEVKGMRNTMLELQTSLNILQSKDTHVYNNAQG